VHVACAGRSARSDPLSAVHDAHSEPGRGVGGMRGHACHSRGTGREGDADAYGRIDMHVVCRGLASFGRSRSVEPTVPRARVMHAPSPAPGGYGTTVASGSCAAVRSGMNSTTS
jgi:hypothetical protein